MGASPIFISSFRTQETIFRSNHGLRPRVIWTPGTSGSRLHALMATSSDAHANNVDLYVGKYLTLGSDMGTGAFVDGAGGDDTITRTSGNFITDGWQEGARLIAQGATTLTNEIVALLTGVASGTLTMATGSVGVAEAIPSGCKLFRAHLIGRIVVGIAAGRNGTDPAVDLLNTTLLPWMDASPNKYLTLGATSYLLAALSATLTTVEDVDIIGMGGDY